MATTSTAQLLDLIDAAERLSVSKARLQRWVKAGKVPCVILPDGEPRFAPADLDAWIEELKRAVTQRSKRAHVK